MKTELSGFMDGEVDAQDERQLLDILKRNDGMRGTWSDYCLVGDALRGEPALDAEIVGRVMAALQDEPVVFLPQRLPPAAANWRRAVLAVAATVAGVAVVGWMALGPQSGPLTTPLAENSQTLVQQVATVERPLQAAALDMREYLLAHQTQSGSLQFRNGTQYIRTVAATAK